MKKVISVVFLLAFFALFIFAGGALATNKLSKHTSPASDVLPLVGAESEPPLPFGPTPMMYEANQPDCGSGRGMHHHGDRFESTSRNQYCPQSNQI